KLNLDWGGASTEIVNDLNLLNKFTLKAYEIAALYKKKIKKYHNQRIENRDFVIEDLLLLFNSRLRLFWVNVKSNGSGDFYSSNCSYMERWSSKRVREQGWMAPKKAQSPKGGPNQLDRPGSLFSMTRKVTKTPITAFNSDEKDTLIKSPKRSAFDSSTNSDVRSALESTTISRA
ncbi:hypothetical protein EJD97_014632, partial [Solanum chilense]